MIERLDMGNNYSSEEASIHINRYSLVKPYCKDKKILDISCGEGYGSYLLSKWEAKEVVGIDISKETIKKAKKDFERENLKYICHDAMNLDIFEDNYFDMIVSFETIEHLTEPKKYLEEIKRVSKEGVIIIISCPNDHYYYPTEEEFNSYHIRKYTSGEFYELVEATLGKADNYLFGTRIQGYANMYASQDVLNKNQLQMLNYKETDKCIIVPENLEINDKNSSYFVCVWGIKENMECLTPYYMGMDDVNKNNIKYIIELEKYQKELIKTVEEYRNQIIELQTELAKKQ